MTINLLRSMRIPTEIGIRNKLIAIKKDFRMLSSWCLGLSPVTLYQNLFPLVVMEVIFE